MATHNELGKKGEAHAVNYLIKKGYAILERNWRFQKAEIDIIASNEKTLAVVEVKTRSSDYYGNPQDFVTPKKIKLLVRAVDEYISKFDIDLEVRFDIIAIINKKNNLEIEHLENAFYHF